MPRVTRKQVEAIVAGALKNEHSNREIWWGDWMTRPYSKLFFRFLETIGVVAGLIAIAIAISSINHAGRQTKLAEQALIDQKLAIDAAADQTALSRQALDNQVISNAWQIITSPTASSHPKAYALHQLWKYKTQQLEGVNFDCINLQHDITEIDVVEYDRQIFTAHCADQPAVEKLELVSALTPNEVGGRDFSYANLRLVEARKITLNNISMWYNILRDATAHATQWENVWIVNSDLNGFKSNSAKWNNVVITKSDISNVKIFGNISLLQLIFVKANNFQPKGHFQFREINLVDFTNSNFSRTAFDFPNESYLGESDSTNPTINISGVEFCKVEAFTKSFNLHTGGWDDNFTEFCASGLTQEFFTNAFYFETNPPKGLPRLKKNFNIRSGCKVPLGHHPTAFLDTFFVEPTTNDPCRYAELFSTEELPLKGNYFGNALISEIQFLPADGDIKTILRVPKLSGPIE